MLHLTYVDKNPAKRDWKLLSGNAKERIIFMLSVKHFRKEQGGLKEENAYLKETES